MAVVAMPRTGVSGLPAFRPSRPVAGQSPPSLSWIVLIASPAERAGAARAEILVSAREPERAPNRRRDTSGGFIAFCRRDALLVENYIRCVSARQDQHDCAGRAAFGTTPCIPSAAR